MSLGNTVYLLFRNLRLSIGGPLMVAWRLHDTEGGIWIQFHGIHSHRHVRNGFEKKSYARFKDCIQYRTPFVWGDAIFVISESFSMTRALKPQSMHLYPLRVYTYGEAGNNSNDSLIAHRMKKWHKTREKGDTVPLISLMKNRVTEPGKMAVA